MSSNVAVCLSREKCYWKSVKQMPKTGKEKHEVPLCRFEENCNQKLILDIAELRVAKYDIKYLRREKFDKFRLGRTEGSNLKMPTVRRRS